MQAYLTGIKFNNFIILRLKDEKIFIIMVAIVNFNKYVIIFTLVSFEIHIKKWFSSQLIFPQQLVK